jgi:RNA polymerase sigma-70 factor (ECF subfamily)
MTLFGKKDDSNAYKFLVERYADRFVCFACLMLGNKEESEDAAQETFIKLVHKRSKYRNDTPFSSWASTILKNLCLDQLRKRKVRNAVPLEDSICYDDEDICEAEKKEGNLLVKEILTLLSEEERKIISLRLYAEHDFASVAKTCGISTENAKKKFYRALGKLKNSLSLSDGVIRIIEEEQG